jgi:Protein of unknown function (DUF664)
MTIETSAISERADLLQMPAKHRFFLRDTVRDLTAEQAATLRSQPGCEGVASANTSPSRIGSGSTSSSMFPQQRALNWRTPADWEDGFRMLERETRAELMAQDEHVPGRTDALVATLPNLVVTYPLPEASWFESGAPWSVRRVPLHVTARACGFTRALVQAACGPKAHALATIEAPPPEGYAVDVALGRPLLLPCTATTLRCNRTRSAFSPSHRREGPGAICVAPSG